MLNQSINSNPPVPAHPRGPTWPPALPPRATNSLDRNVLLEQVFQVEDGDSDEVQIWQVTEMRGDRDGWTYTIIDDDDEQPKTLDEQALLASSSVL